MPFKNDNQPPDRARLRQRAEDLLKLTRSDMEHMQADEMKALAHELQVHQIELETTIEDLRNTQVELSNAYSRYRELYDDAPVGYMTMDDKGKIVEVNTTIVQMLSASKAELIGKYLMSLVTTVDQDRIHRYLKGIHATNEILTEDFSFERFESREIINLRVRAKPGLFISEGIREWKVTLVDITDEKHAQKGLRDATLQQKMERILLQAIMDTIPVMLFIYDPPHENLQINKAVARITGWSEKDYLGNHVFELLFGDQNPLELVSFFDSGIYEWRDYPIRCKDNSSKVVNWTHARLDDGRQVTIGIDVTERNRLEHDLHKKASELAIANSEMEAFVHSVTHDLRNPLHAITTFVQFIKEDYQQSLDGRGNEYLDRIYENAMTMKQIINALLSLTQVSRRDLNYEKVNLSEIAEEILAQLRITSPRENMHVEIDHDIIVHADRSLIRMVMQNLLQNAWKYSSKKEHARINFGWKIIDGKKVCFINDNGAGFDQKKAKHLFNSFLRLHSEKEFSGTGIGLAIVKRIIDHHNGRAWAEAEPEIGATFYFSLPE